MRDPSPRLGRGLATLLGQTDSEEHQPAKLRYVRLGDLDPNPYQPRALLDPASLQELADSIRDRGVLQPLLVRQASGATDRLQIVAGERRWRAARAAGLAEVPCLVVTMHDQEASLAALVENLQREDLGPLEEAEGFRNLIDKFGFSQESLAAAMGKSRSHVANTLRLLNLPAAVLEHLRLGRITAGHGRALLAHLDPTRAARIVIDRGLSVRQTEALVNAPAKPERRATGEPSTGPDIAALERDLAQKLGLKVVISDRRGAGRVTLHYRSLDQLDGLISLLAGS